MLERVAIVHAACGVFGVDALAAGAKAGAKYQNCKEDFKSVHGMAFHLASSLTPPGAG